LGADSAHISKMVNHNLKGKILEELVTLSNKISMMTESLNGMEDSDGELMYNYLVELNNEVTANENTP